MKVSNILKQARKLDFSTESEYYDYLIDSYYNGNFEQCKGLFKALKSDEQKQLLSYAYDFSACYMFYFDLL